MKNIVIFFLLIYFIISLSLPEKAYAENTNYVLPYPSYMPGNLLYLPSVAIGHISSIFYFGDFGKLEYSIKESDHYLVEAKTLFEYNQYLLGIRALKKSDNFFKDIPKAMTAAKNHNKNTNEKEPIIENAARKHIEILTKLRADLPPEFIWTPEKDAPTKINFSELIGDSLNIRTEI